MAGQIDIKKLERELKKLKKTRRKFPKKLLRYTLITLCMIILIILVVWFVNYIIESSVAFTCDTPECFIEKANNCEAAVYETQIETITLNMETDGCELTKEVIAVSGEEPESIRELFKGTEMTCEYEQNEFNRKYLDQISYDLATCEGSLVEAVKAVL